MHAITEQVMTKGPKGQEFPAVAPNPTAKAIESWDNEGGAPSTDDRSRKKGKDEKPPSATSLSTRAQSAKCTSHVKTARSAPRETS